MASHFRFCLKNFMDKGSLVGYSPKGRKKPDTTECACMYGLSALLCNRRKCKALGKLWGWYKHSPTGRDDGEYFELCASPMLSSVGCLSQGATMVSPEEKLIPTRKDTFSFLVPTNHQGLVTQQWVSRQTSLVSPDNQHSYDLLEETHTAAWADSDKRGQEIDISIGVLLNILTLALDKSLILLRL